VGKERRFNKFESKVNPKQITDEKNLTGKVVARFSSFGYSHGIRIDFTDGMFVLLELDYSGCYYEGDRPDLAIVKEYRNDEGNA
jgi:hypothetical protein